MTYKLLISVCYLFITAIISPVSSQSLLIGGSGSDLGTFRLLATEFNQSHPHVEIKIFSSMGSTGGIKALKHQKLNIALTSRPLKKSEISPELHIINYAKTPLVFATSNTSQLQNITKEQVNQIYSGSLKQWSDGSPVRPVLRPLQDSDSKILINTMVKLNKNFTQIYQRKGIPVALTDQDAADMIADIPGAIGTSALSVIVGENRLIKTIKFDGIVPSVENIQNKSYPMVKDLYLVYNKNNKLPILNKFIDFIFSEKGQSILLKTGHLTIR